MAPSTGFPSIARTQLYFVDACRNLPTQIQNFETLQTTAVFDVTLGGFDDRRAPIFYASVPDGRAGAIPNTGTLFSQALLECLRGGAGQTPNDNATATRAITDWHVTYRSLHEAIIWHMDDQNQRFNWQQELITDGFARDAVICYLPGPPQVPLQIQVAPDTALVCTAIDLTPVAGGGLPAATLMIPAGTQPHPFDRTVAAGMYMVNATVTPPTPPFQNKARPIEVLPPFRRCRMGMS